MLWDGWGGSVGTSQLPFFGFDRLFCFCIFAKLISGNIFFHACESCSSAIRLRVLAHGSAGCDTHRYAWHASSILAAHMQAPRPPANCMYTYAYMHTQCMLIAAMRTCGSSDSIVTNEGPPSAWRATRRAIAIGSSCGASGVGSSQGSGAASAACSKDSLGQWLNDMIDTNVRGMGVDRWG